MLNAAITKIDEAIVGFRSKIGDAVDEAANIRHNSLDETVESVRQNMVTKEVEIIDSRGSPLGEFDEIDLKKKIFYEDKSAQGLNTLNPRTGMPVQTPEQFADKQIYTKTKNRINNLFEATGTREAKRNSLNVPNIEELKEIKEFRFRLDGDTPALRSAVENSLNKLRLEFPDYMFSAEFGGGN